MNRQIIAKELLKMARDLLSMEFNSQEEKDNYVKKHDVKPGTKLTVNKFGKGQKVKIKKHFRDPGEDEIHYHVEEDNGDRLHITPVDWHSGPIRPIEVVKKHMVERV